MYVRTVLISASVSLRKKHSTTASSEIAEKEQVLNMHKSYAAKGRNHLSASYEQDILALPETPPGQRRHKSSDGCRVVAQLFKNRPHLRSPPSP